MITSNCDPLSVVAMLRGIAIHVGDGRVWVCSETKDRENHETMYTAYNPHEKLLYTVLIKTGLPAAPVPEEKAYSPWYRNNEDYLDIEADSLWKIDKREGIMVLVLVDEDRDLAVPFNPDDPLFRKEDIPL